MFINKKEFLLYIKNEFSILIYKIKNTTMRFKDWFTKNNDKGSIKPINEQAKRECPVCNGEGYCDGDTCDECNGEGYINNDENWYEDQPKRREKKGKKDEKEVKKFEVGDVLVITDKKKSSKMPEDAYDFLMTYKTFTVNDVSDSGKLNLGCRISKNENGKGVEKIYLFSPNRFELKEPRKEEIKP